MTAWARIDHDGRADDPPGVVDVPSPGVGLLFMLAFPVALVWVLLTGAWTRLTRWR